MKKIKFIASLMFVMATAAGFTSCSSDDDDDPALDAPAFDAYAAKYEISSSNSPYASVEFTESGNYIIVMDENVNGNAPAAMPAKGKVRKMSVLSKNMLAGLRRTNTREAVPFSPILYGKYTKTGDNTYVLEGFGSVEVVTDGNGNAVSLKITRTGGRAETYTATKLNKNLNSAMSNKLCRTWSIEGLRMYIRLNGKTMMDISGRTFAELVKNVDEWAKKNIPDYDEGDLGLIEILGEIQPKQVVFTKTGTYMVYYENSTLAVATWRWYNKAETTLQYSWTNRFDNEDDLNGIVDIDFKGGKLLVTEKETETDEDGTMETGLVYTMGEVK